MRGTRSLLTARKSSNLVFNRINTMLHTLTTEMNEIQDPLWQSWTDFREAPDKVLKFHQNHARTPKLPDLFSKHTQETSLE